MPTSPWKDISMDFITGLPPCNAGISTVYDAILVVVDKYTKMAKYTPVQKTIDAATLANIFHDRIVMKFGTPASIVTDRDSLFTSHFWSSLCFYMKARRRLSTAFHPQTDGQTERQNQVLEHYLRCYVNHKQDNWVKYLPMAEFVYNNSVHASTGMTPFYALYGYHPEFSWDVSTEPPNKEAPSAKERIEDLLNERKHLEERLRKAIEYQAKPYNAKHTPKHFAMGDYVLLSSKNIKMNRPSKKLDHRFLGPFQIIKIIGKQAYKLALPPSYRAIHPVFHVSLLEPYQRRPGDATELPLPIPIEGEEEWQVEQILDHRVRRGKRQYLVRWLGFPPSEDTWEPETNLEHAQQKLREYQVDNEGENPAQPRPNPGKAQGRRRG
jgi:hypothetical protein